MTSITLSITNDPRSVQLLGVCVRQISAFGFIPDRCAEIELAVVEAVNNAIEHAYGEHEQGIIRVKYTLSDAEAVIEVIDYGAAMDSKLATASAGDFNVDPEDLEHLPEGGMGIMLINRCMDEAHYQSKAGCNRWILKKYRSKEEQS